jgi:hypothetical protein
MDRRALAAICIVFAAGWVLVSPWKNVPVMDDWVYAWSVEHFLASGQLRVSDYSSVYPIAQVLWGSLFAALAGFSFGALRLSTVLLAVGGCYAIYLTLRELGVDALASLIAALTVALSPVYFALSFTFMTDVPFVAVSSIALFFYVSAIVRGEPRRLWWGSAAALVAFFIRPLAVVLPIAAVFAVSPRDWKEGWARAVAPLALPFAVMIAAWIAMPHIFGRLPIADSRIEELNNLALVTPREYAGWDFNLPIIAAFPFAPLLLASLVSKQRIFYIALTSVALAVLSWITLGHLATPLPDWQTWSLEDLATRGGLIGGDLKPSLLAVRLTPILSVIGIVASASLIVGLGVARYRLRRGMVVLLSFGVMHVVLFNVLWFFNDRYYLVLAPSLAFFAAAPFADARWNRRLLWVAAPVLALWAFISITGTRDMLATNATVARLTHDLEAQGVPPSDIDAGYTLNGWRLYAHPENLPPHADPHWSVPFVTSKRPTPYRIVNTPGPGEDVIRVEPLPAATWQVTDRVFVVRRSQR